MKAAVIFTPGFEEIEAVTPVDVLRRLGCDVITAGTHGTAITGSHGITLVTDTTVDALNAGVLDAVILPGGTVKICDCAKVIELVQSLYAQNKLVAAVCAAPVALARAGILKGKKATVYPAENLIAELLNAGAVHTEERVVKDGFILTGKGPGASFEFAFAVAEALGFDTKALQEAMIIP